MNSCPIRKLAQQELTIYLYKDILAKEAQIKEKRNTETNETIEQMLIKLEKLWKNLFKILATNKLIKRLNHNAKNSLVWSNLLGSTYNPEELIKQLNGNLDRINIYFTFWNN